VLLPYKALQELKALVRTGILSHFGCSTAIAASGRPDPLHSCRKVREGQRERERQREKTLLHS